MSIWNPCCRPGDGQEVWRVVCACGQTSQQWSVSQGAAIRAWNRNLAQADVIAPETGPSSSPARLKK